MCCGRNTQILLSKFKINSKPDTNEKTTLQALTTQKTNMFTGSFLFNNILLTKRY